MQHITKLCADSLRSFTFENYGIKLKAAHAHELTAAYFGYKSKNSMLADDLHPLSDLSQAKIFVMAPESFIDKRRQELDGLSSELPDSYTLGEAVFSPLFSSEELWTSAFPPFRSFMGLVKFMAQERGVIENGQLYGTTRHHILDIKSSDESVLLTVKHACMADNGNMLVDAVSKIELPRVAGLIGYGLAHISEERGTDRVREVLVPKVA